MKVTEFKLEHNGIEVHYVNDTLTITQKVQPVGTTEFEVTLPKAAKPVPKKQPEPPKLKISVEQDDGSLAPAAVEPAHVNGSANGSANSHATKQTKPKPSAKPRNVQSDAKAQAIADDAEDDPLPANFAALPPAPGEEDDEPEPGAEQTDEVSVVARLVALGEKAVKHGGGVPDQLQNAKVLKDAFAFFDTEGVKSVEGMTAVCEAWRDAVPCLVQIERAKMAIRVKGLFTLLAQPE